MKLVAGDKIADPHNGRKMVRIAGPEEVYLYGRDASRVVLIGLCGASFPAAAIKEYLEVVHDRCDDGPTEKELERWGEKPGCECQLCLAKRALMRGEKLPPALLDLDGEDDWFGICEQLIATRALE